MGACRGYYRPPRHYIYPDASHAAIYAPSKSACPAPSCPSCEACVRGTAIHAHAWDGMKPCKRKCRSRSSDNNDLDDPCNRACPPQRQAKGNVPPARHERDQPSTCLPSSCWHVACVQVCRFRCSTKLASCSPHSLRKKRARKAGTCFLRRSHSIPKASRKPARRPNQARGRPCRDETVNAQARPAGLKWAHGAVPLQGLGWERRAGG